MGKSSRFPEALCRWGQDTNEIDSILHTWKGVGKCCFFFFSQTAEQPLFSLLSTAASHQEGQAPLHPSCTGHRIYIGLTWAPSHLPLGCAQRDACSLSKGQFIVEMPYNWAVMLPDPWVSRKQHGSLSSRKCDLFNTFISTVPYPFIPLGDLV